MARSVFADVWRESEAAYSGVLAQTLALSATYRSLLLLNLSKESGGTLEAELMAAAKAPSGAITIKTEKYFGSFGRIDIYADFDGLFVLGIENKKTTGLQTNQLTRYGDYLREKAPHYLLVFLAPSTYDKVPGRDRLVQLSYKTLNEWTLHHLNK